MCMRYPFRNIGSLVILLFTFFICYTFCFPDLQAQEKGKQLTGFVADAGTSKPLPCATIYLKASKTGVTTGPDGKFSIQLPTDFDTLMFSYIGYHTEKIPVPDTIEEELQIRLESKAIDLPEVLISAAPFEVVFRDKSYAVLDYELDDSYLFILVHRNNLKRAELVVLDQNNDTADLITDLPGKAGGLIKDCLDQIHYYNAEYAYQLVCRDRRFYLYFTSTLERYREIFRNCVTCVGDYIVFRKPFFYDLGVEYYAINKYSLERKSLAFLEDKFSINMLVRNDIAYFGDERISNSALQDIPGDLSSREALQNIRNMNVERHFLINTFYTPMIAPLKRLDQNLILFDYPGSVIRFYDHYGDQYLQIPFSFHLKEINEKKLFPGLFLTKKWEGYDMITDELQYKVFALESESGKTILKEIDPYSGSVASEHSLHHYFPEKIRLRNGYVYYLYESKSDWSRKKLYRQPLF